MKSISSSPPLNRCIQMIGIMLLFLLYHIVYRKVLLYGRVLRRKKNIYEIAYHNNNNIILYYTMCTHAKHDITDIITYASDYVISYSCCMDEL